MRGIEAVVAIVLLLIMTVGLVAIVWMIFGPTMRQSTSATGQQIKNTTSQQAKATQFTTVKSICEGQYVGGHFIEDLNQLTTTKWLNLSVGGVKVHLHNVTNGQNVICPKNAPCWACVYRMGMEPDSPVALAVWKNTSYKLSAMTEVPPKASDVYLNITIK